MTIDNESVVVFGPTSKERCEQFLDNPPKDFEGKRLVLGAYAYGESGGYVVFATERTG